MRRKLVCLCLAVLMLLSSVPAVAVDGTEQPEVQLSNGEARQMENIDRGAIAATAPTGGVYLSWRLLGTEPMDTVFNIYKNGTILCESLNNTNYTDASGTASDVYCVAPVINGVEGEKCDDIQILTGYADRGYESVPYTYFDIPIQNPDPNSDTYNPSDPSKVDGGANDASVGDVDGDGRYEIILKWNPNDAKDSASGGVTGIVYIDCYEFDGTLLWRINLGRNIRAGAHYTQFQVYDYDGDGKAEVAMKTAPGTIDGKGNYVSEAGNTEEIRSADNSKSYVGSNGHITGGPEYLTIFNGETGAAMQTIDYDPPLGNVRDWGDNSYNRSDRYLAGTAYLDGVHPSMIFCRGYYGKSVVAAYDWDGENLTQRWRLDSTSSSSNDFYGQGNHNLSVADIDNDGYDEIVYGSAAIDHDGTLAHSTGFGHGDALHVSDFDNDGGQEIFGVLEDSPDWGEAFRDGDGNVIWHYKAGDDDGRGAMAYFSRQYGVLAWDGYFGIRTLDGTLISEETVQDNKWSYPNFPIYWDGDLCREHFDGNRISKFNDETVSFDRLWNLSGTSYNNTSKKNPCLQADILGDWREELIMRTSDNNALRVFISISPTDYKFTTFMHDSQYRCAVAWQNTAYNQPPHQSYYIGYDKDVSEYVQPNIYVNTINPEAKITVLNSSGDPVSGINVMLGGIEKPTDASGEAAFRLEPGTYEYSVSVTGYYDLSGTFDFTSGADSGISLTLSELPDSVLTVISGGTPVSGASVTIGGQTAVTGADGKVTMKLKPGVNTYTAECKKFVTETGEFTVPENSGVTETIELEAIVYSYDSAADTEGSRFTYSGDSGAALTFSNGEWTFAQNSTDGGRSFGAVFTASENGHMQFEMTYNTGGQTDASDEWNWSGRNYTHSIKLLDLYGETLIGLSQEYNDSGVQEVKYFTGSSPAANVSGGETIGGPNITKRSSFTWRIVFDIDLENRTAELTLTDEAEENGYRISDIPLNSSSFASVQIGSEADGNVTWAPRVKDVLYLSDCETESTPSTPPPATPSPTPVPMSYTTWDFNDQPVGTTYENEGTIADTNGEVLSALYGTSALANASAPAIAERTSGDNYYSLTDNGAGQDGWSYSPLSPLSSEMISFETDFRMGDTNKDAVIFRVFDANNSTTANTYTTSSDGRSFEIKTGDNGTLKFSDYYSRGSSDTKALDRDVSGFTFSANTWYSVKAEYYPDTDEVKVYTKNADSTNYTLRNTFTLGSGTSKVSNVPALSPTRVSGFTRGSSANVMAFDNISVGVVDTAVQPSEPSPTPTTVPDGTYMTDTVYKAEEFSEGVDDVTGTWEVVDEAAYAELGEPFGTIADFSTEYTKSTYGDFEEMTLYVPETGTYTFNLLLREYRDRGYTITLAKDGSEPVVIDCISNQTRVASITDTNTINIGIATGTAELETGIYTMSFSSTNASRFMAFNITRAAEEPTDGYFYTIDSAVFSGGSVTLSVTRNNESAGDAKIIIAAYDGENGAMVAAASADLTASTDLSSGISVALPSIENAENVTIKTFIWSAGSDLQPYAVSKPAEIQ